MISVAYDQATGVIHTITQGETSRDEIERYLIELDQLIERGRREWGRFWHLVDASRLEVQSEENLRCLAGAGIEFQHEEDRTAVVMESPRAKAQLVQMPSQFRTVIFPDLASANAWLHGLAIGATEH